MSSKIRKDVLDYIEGFRVAGYSLNWQIANDGLVKVYVADFAKRQVNIDAPFKILKDLRKEVEGN